METKFKVGDIVISKSAKHPEPIKIVEIQQGRYRVLDLDIDGNRDCYIQFINEHNFSLVLNYITKENKC